MDSEIDPIYDYVIIGGGVAGSIAFSYLSKEGKTLLIDKRKAYSYPDSVRILVTHTEPFLKTSIPKEDRSIFIRPVNKIENSSRNKIAIIPGMREFGQPFGWVINEKNFINWHLRDGENSGGTILWETEIIDVINIHNKANKENQNNENQKKKSQRNVICKSKDGKKIQADYVLLATGSYGVELQKKIGFDIPFQLNYLTIPFYGSPSQLEENMRAEYMFHLNPKISTAGPLEMTLGNDFFSMIYVSDEDYEEMEDKFLRILKNYKVIKQFFKGVKNPPEQLTKKEFRRGKISKHPIKNWSIGRIFILGEATGLVTPCYYEGFLGGVVMAMVLRDLFVEIREKKINAENLGEKYYNKINSMIRGNFEASQIGSEQMFLTPGPDQQIIWDAYLEAINSNKKVRRNIHYAWVSPHFVDYPLENDEYCGEKIYLSLPLGRRIKLTPYFLKLKFSK